jgi:hypothetical protein
MRRAATRVQISRDGTGRMADTICVARRWRTVTVEEVDRRDDAPPREVQERLGASVLSHGSYNEQ